MRLWKNKFGIFLFLTALTCLSACGFHLQGEIRLAKPLHLIYLQAQDPYGNLVRYLEDYLKMSNVQVTAYPNQATTILVIENDSNSQSLLSVSGTQQTRQYNLAVNVTYYITDANGKVIVPPQALSEARTLTIQSNQVLGSSNEAVLIYQQIRRSLAAAIMNRLSSQEITEIIDKSFETNIVRHSIKRRQH